MENKNPNNILTKNNSVTNLKSNFKLEYFNELPFINSKKTDSDMNKKPRKKLFLQKLTFNPISYNYLNKIKQLSQVTPIAKNINKHFSIKEITEFTKRKFYIKNIRRDIENDSTKRRNKIHLKLITRNNSDINLNKNNRPSLNIIDLTNNCSIKNNNNIPKKIGKKSLIDFTYRNYINYKKYLDNIYNPKEHKGKGYLNKIRYVHNCIYKTPENKIKLEEKNSDEIIPKYEYICYYGIPNKIITKLTSAKLYSENDKNFENQYLKSKVQLKTPPDFDDCENMNDYRNKKYIKQIEQKNKMQKLLEEELKDKNEMKNIVQRSRRDKEKYRERNKTFEEMVNDAFRRRNEINKKLEEAVDADKKIYEREFEKMQKESLYYIYK